MQASDKMVVLEHYGRRYIERVGRMPRKKDLDPDLAQNLVSWFGGVENAIHVLDAWFDSPDPWYAKEGFAFQSCFTPIYRLISTGCVRPQGTPYQQVLGRKLCAAMFRERPRLRLVWPRDES